MDSFLLLCRLVAAIVFKGQTVSDYWWSRRTIFLTPCTARQLYRMTATTQGDRRRTKEQRTRADNKCTVFQCLKELRQCRLLVLRGLPVLGNLLQTLLHLFRESREARGTRYKEQGTRRDCGGGREEGARASMTYFTHIYACVCVYS